MYILKLKTAEKNLFKLYKILIHSDTIYQVFSIKNTKHFHSVIRSPHANKNSQEQFYQVFFKHVVKVNKKQNINFNELKNSLLQDQNIFGSISELKIIQFNSFFKWSIAKW